MKALIAAYNESKKTAEWNAQAAKLAFADLPIADKLVALIAEGTVWDDILNYKSYYSGCGGSLYDDFYWDRRETKTISDVLEITIENLDNTDGDESPAELAALILAQPDDDRCAVLIDMANHCIGRARYDW